jgi:hypothetical protein
VIHVGDLLRIALAVFAIDHLRCWQADDTRRRAGDYAVMALTAGVSIVLASSLVAAVVARSWPGVIIFGVF